MGLFAFRVCALAATALSLLGAAALQRTGVAQSRPPNIVFILADDLGINDLGVYGRSEHRTPHLDRLAAEGLRFTSAYVASPICSPSRAAIMTGRAPARVHITTFIPGRGDAPSQKLLHPPMRQQLPLEETTLAEALRGAGYVSALIGKWHLGGAGFAPTDQGFDVYHAGRATTRGSDTEGGKGEYDLTREAERFIDANRDRPFFLFLAHNNPHIPFLSAKPELVAANSHAFEPAYAATVQTLDDSVGRLLAHLDAAGLSERTIVIFTSDNGGLHMPEGPHARVTHNTPFRAGKGYLYEGGLRVPLIVRGPGLASRRVIDAPLVNTDWLPTLLELVGARPVYGLDGVSQARLLRTGTPPPGARTFYWHIPHYTNQGSRPAGAVREGKWKLVEHYDDGQAELFDLDRDAGETRDLSTAEPVRTTAMRNRLRDWRTSVGAQENTPNPAVDVDLYQKIYVQFDSSRFDPLRADAAAWKAAAAWRERMDAAIAGPPPKPQAPPNILLIISDDHAWSDYGFIGHPIVKTPSIDRLAASGTLYTRGYVPTAVCRPSLATLLTGRYPHQHGITGNDPPGGATAMHDPAARATMVDVFRRNTALPAMLGARGYVSLQTGKWWEGRPQDSGFTAAMTHGDVARGGRHGDEGLKIGREGLQPIYDFIDWAAGRPFFIWYAPFLPHTPHTPPDRLLKKYDGAGIAAPVARYYAMIEWLDETVGELLDHLDRKRLGDNTIVVYVADNGWIQSPDPKPAQPTRAKMSPYDAGIRTPIIVRWRGRAAAVRDDTTLAGTIDVVPTLLKAAGIEPPADLPGLDLLDRRAMARREEVFGSVFVHTAVDVANPIANLKYRYVVREDGWKLILPFTPNRDAPLMIDGRTADWMRFEPELYNVLRDPGEERNLAAERPDLVKELRASIDRWWRDGPQRGDEPEQRGSARADGEEPPRASQILKAGAVQH